VEYQEKTSRLQRRLTQAEQRATAATQQVWAHRDSHVEGCAFPSFSPHLMLTSIICHAFVFFISTAEYVDITAKENSHGRTGDFITATVAVL